MRYFRVDEDAANADATGMRVGVDHNPTVSANEIRPVLQHTDFGGGAVGVYVADTGAAAGGAFKAVVREFLVQADVNGKIDLDFLQGGVMGVDGNPIVNAIEVLSS
jgi:hypothetical protein